MIGKIIIGKSFRGCISYCLENKKQSEQKEQVIQQRAEVLCYNLCYGDKLDLIRQFNEVRNLNPKLGKSVMHVTLSLAPGEQLGREKLAGLVEDCARELGFEKNQFIAIAHNDTHHQHLHIVINRVGFDGKTVKDNNNYQKMAAYCRKMELKHELQQVLSPRRFLSKEQRNISRIDQRKIKLRRDIRDCLNVSKSYQEFEQKMKQRNFQVQKARGIAFIDPQKVRIKGSEVGYSLSQIQKIVSLQSELKKNILRKEQPGETGGSQILPSKSLNQQQHFEKHKSLRPSVAADLLLKPSAQQENIQPALIKKKRKKKRSQHL